MKLPRHSCGLYITHNDHLCVYKTAKDEIEDLESLSNPTNRLDWATEESRARCIATNELWEIQWYPDTPIGSYSIFGATLEETLAAANELDGALMGPSGVFDTP